MDIFLQEHTSPLYLGHEVVPISPRPGILQEVKVLEVYGCGRRGEGGGPGELGGELGVGPQAGLEQPEGGAGARSGGKVWIAWCFDVGPYFLPLFLDAW